MHIGLSKSMKCPKLPKLQEIMHTHRDLKPYILYFFLPDSFIDGKIFSGFLKVDLLKDGAGLISQSH